MSVDNAASLPPGVAGARAQAGQLWRSRAPRERQLIAGGGAAVAATGGATGAVGGVTAGGTGGTAPIASMSVRCLRPRGSEGRIPTASVFSAAADALSPFSMKP